MASMQLADRQQRLDALAARLADADQDAGGERNLGLAGAIEGVQAHGRHLVGGAVVRHALLGEALRDRLQHDAHAGRDRPQHGDLCIGHGAGIQVWQQAGFAEHALGNVVQILEGGLEAELRQRLAGSAITQLRAFTEGEQRLLATQFGSLSGDLQYLVRGQVRRIQVARRLRERAVVAHVTAQVSQRDEHLLRIGDGIGEADVAQLAGSFHQGRQIVTCGQRQRLVGVGQLAGNRALRQRGQIRHVESSLAWDPRFRGR